MSHIFFRIPLALWSTQFHDEKKTRIKFRVYYAQKELNNSEFVVLFIVCFRCQQWQSSNWTGQHKLTSLVSSLTEWRCDVNLWYDHVYSVCVYVMLMYVCDHVNFMCRRSEDRKKGKSKNIHAYTCKQSQTKCLNDNMLFEWVCVCAAKYVMSVECVLLCYDLINYCWSSFIVIQKGLVCEYTHTYRTLQLQNTPSFWWTRVCNAHSIAHNWFKHFIKIH